MTEILFYHLEQAPLEKVLPVLLEKTLQKNWRAVVELGSAERLEFLDTALWTYRDDSFLPHCVANPKSPLQANPLQPIILCADSSNPNNAQIRFFVDRALPRTDVDYERLVFMFDGHDPEAVQEARSAWKNLSGAHETTYWQQGQNGRWTKKA